MNINKLVGVGIDTNIGWWPSIKEGEEERVLKQITNAGYNLSSIRRVVNRSDMFFTGFTYHYDQGILGETLEDFLNR